MENDRETIAEFLGDDSLQSAGYGLYAMFGKPAAIPVEEKISQLVKEMAITDPTSEMIWRRKLEAKEHRKTAPVHFGRRLNHRQKVTY